MISCSKDRNSLVFCSPIREKAFANERFIGSRIFRASVLPAGVILSGMRLRSFGSRALDMSFLRSSLAIALTNVGGSTFMSSEMLVIVVSSELSLQRIWRMLYSSRVSLMPQVSTPIIMSCFRFWSIFRSNVSISATGLSRFFGRGGFITLSYANY
jgi:hypothetical protein